jgi:hexosaminidase
MRKHKYSNMNRIILLALLIAANTSCFTQELNIIPQPAELKLTAGGQQFTISSKTEIVLMGSSLGNSAAFLNDYLRRFYGITLAIKNQSQSKDAIRLNFERMDNALPGAYTLEVGKEGVYIAGDNEQGAFYGVQTLIQLLPAERSSALRIPFVAITDRPRFQYRGAMLDVSRHFFTVAYIKKFIDYLALHKMNYLHWHLTDDQGWRIEIKKYPKLVSVGAYRNGTLIGKFPGTGNDGIRYGGYYTQNDVKDIVKYAAARYITVVPEIEMPGHASAAIAAYPELSCFPNESTTHSPRAAWNGDSTGKQVQQTWGVHKDVFCPGEKTFKFLEDVLDEVLPLFPSKYVHIGGDECPKDNWKRSELAQKLIKEKNLKDEHGLQSYFIQRIEKYINSKGKSIIGWDEILEGGLAPNATVMSWRGEKGGIEAAKQNHNVIMTPNTYVYLDYSQTKKEDSVVIGGFLPVQKVYSYEPVPAELPANQTKFILGGQANLWTEYVKNPGKVEYMLFPRMTALSEVLWSPKEKRNWNDFEKRLSTQLKRYDLWGANYSKAYQDPASTAGN